MSDQPATEKELEDINAAFERWRGYYARGYRPTLADLVLMNPVDWIASGQAFDELRLQQATMEALAHRDPLNTAAPEIKRDAMLKGVVREAVSDFNSEFEGDASA